MWIIILKVLACRTKSTFWTEWLNLQQREDPRFLFLCFQLDFNGFKAVILKLVCLCKSPGDLIKCRVCFSGSTVGPEVLHFEQAHDWYCCWPMDHTWVAGSLGSHEVVTFLRMSWQSKGRARTLWKYLGSTTVRVQPATPPLVTVTLWCLHSVQLCSKRLAKNWIPWHPYFCPLFYR